MTQCVFCGDSDRPGDLFQCQISNGKPCSPCIKLKRLGSQIREAKRVLDLLVQQQRELKTQMNRIHDPITNRLPPEIASYIFQFCMPEALCDFSGVWKLSKDEASAPLILGAVCRHWRQLVWSSPGLWTYIQVNLDAPDLPGRCNIAQGWLDRSGSRLPLSIHIYATDSSLNLQYHMEDVRQLIETINRYSNRWHLLDLNIPKYMFPKFCGDSHSVSVLHTLRLKPHAHYYDYDDHRFSMKHLKPRPECVFLSGLHFKAVEIEWDNVFRVKLEKIELQDCIELLKHASRLRHCTFRGVVLDGEVVLPIHTGTTFHPQLNLLDVTTNFGDTLNSFFAHVAFPPLEKLSFNAMVSPPDLISFFNRSSSHLRELDILDLKMNSEDLITLLEAIPSLRRLEIATLNLGWPDYSPDNLFEHLARTSISNGTSDEQTEGCFLPELQFFRCRALFPISCKFVPSIFGPLSELDNPGRRPLNTIQIQFHHSGGNPFCYIDKEMMPDIFAVLEAGLSLEILYPNHTDPDVIKASMEYHGMVENK